MDKKIKKILTWSSITTVIAVSTIFYFSHRGAISDKDHPIPDCDYMLSSNLQEIIRPALIEKLRFDPMISNTAFDTLLISNDPLSIEARVVLLAYYIGEHSGHVLIESIMPQHKVAAPFIKKYKSCRPPLQSEWQIGTFRVSRFKYDIYSEWLSSNNG